MRRLSLRLLATVSAALLAAACGSSNNNAKQAASPSASATRPASATAALASPGAAAGSATATPRPAVTPAVASTPAATLAPGTTPVANASGCLTFPLKPLDGSNLPTQIPRPQVKIEDLTVPASIMPAGFTPDDGGKFSPQEVRKITDLITGTADPQAAQDYLIQIGFAGGRQQGFTAKPNPDTTIPTITIQHFIFNSDWGARNFVQDPVVINGTCVKQEQPPQVGQDTNALSFTAQAVGSGSLPFEGFGILFRCGRVTLQVIAAGTRGQYSVAQTADIARKVLAEFVKAGQPCA